MLFLQKLICFAIDLSMIAIIIDAILSWIKFSTEHKAYNLLHKVSEYFLVIARKLIPRSAGSQLGIDFSPLVAIIGLRILKEIVIWLTNVTV